MDPGLSCDNFEFRDYKSLIVNAARDAMNKDAVVHGFDDDAGKVVILFNPGFLSLP